MEQYISDAIAYLFGGGGSIGRKGHAEAVNWLKEYRPGISDVEAIRAVSVAAVACGKHTIDGYKLPYLFNYGYVLKPGDTATGGRTYYDEHGEATGVIKSIERGIISFVDGNWCSMKSVYKVAWKDAWKNEPATAEQLEMLAAIKEEHDDKDELFVHSSLTKGDASILIDLWPKPGQVQCWECGSWFYPKDGTTDFFDRWYCGC